MATEKSVQSPESLAVLSETAHAARAALQALPQEEREAVCLCCEQNLSRSVVAEVLGLPEQTIVDRMQRGLEKLRLRLAAQGFTALTPLAVGEGLRELGVPPASAELLETVRALTQSARASLRMSRRVAGQPAAASAGVKAALGFALIAVVSVGAWVLGNRPALVPPPPLPTPPSVLPLQPPAVPASKPSVPVAKEEQPLCVRWNFANGPATDLEVVGGAWSWKRGEGGVPGVMVVPQGVTEVLLPTPVPKAPFRVSAKITWSSRPGPKIRWSAGAGWSDGKGKLAFQNYEKRWIGSPAGAYDAQTYFIERYAIQYPVYGKEERVTLVREHAEPYPAGRVHLWFTNSEVEYTVAEIELRVLRAEEIPLALRNPGALKAGLEAVPAEQARVFRAFAPKSINPDAQEVRP